MQKGLAIIGLLCCAAGVCRAGDAPLARVNAVYTSAMGGCWGLSPGEMGDRWGSCAPQEVLVRTKTVNGAQQSIKWCAPFPLAVCAAEQPLDNGSGDG